MKAIYSSLVPITALLLSGCSDKQEDVLIEPNSNVDTAQLPANDKQLSTSNALAIFQNITTVINEDQMDRLFSKAQADLKFQSHRFYLTNTSEEIMFSQSAQLDTPYQMETGFGADSFNNLSARNEYVCAAGGVIDQYGADGGATYQGGIDRVFNDCAVGEHTYNGTIGRHNDQLRGVISRYPFYNFSATDALGSTSSVSGEFHYGNTSFVSLQKFEGWTDAAFTEPTSQGLFSLTEFNINRADTNNNYYGGVLLTDGTNVTLKFESFSSQIDGSFVVSAPWSNNQPLAVSVSLRFSQTTRAPTDSTITDIPGDISTRADFQWQQGVIEVTAQDGSSMQIMPINSASNTFTIELNNGEIIGPINWSETYAINCGSVNICP